MSSIVVADTGPLHYLILVDAADFLENLFDCVYIPATVENELLNISAPEKVRQWMSARRRWLEVRQVKAGTNIQGLHQGESEAIQLALEMRVRSLLMDDLDGRMAARGRGLAVVGTLGIWNARLKKICRCFRTLSQHSGKRIFSFRQNCLKALWNEIGCVAVISCKSSPTNCFNPHTRWDVCYAIPRRWR